MTPEQIDAATQELCRLRGVRPFDERPAWQDAAGRALVNGTPRPTLEYELFSQEVKRFSEVGTAIAHALGTTPEQEPLARTSAME